VFFVVVVYISNLFFDEIRAYRIVLFYIHYWSAIWGFICGIRFKVIDRDKVPNDRPYVFICNHRSSLDAMLWGYSNNFLVKGLAKKELMKVPLIGFLFRKTCVVVDRGSKESRKESFKQLRDYFDRNVSIFFFAEGTRNKTEQPLKSFYDGAFRMAIELQEPLAPLVMCNTAHLMPTSSMLYKPGITKCVFLDPVPTTGLTLDDLPELKEKVYKTMEQAILKHDIRFAK